MAASIPQDRRELTLPSDMTTSTATISNTSSRRTSGQTQKTGETPQNVPPDMKRQSDKSTPKRPKRTLKLTTSQRERKRAIDREAQRSIRLKTKNYIAHLENLVKIMENGGESAQQPSGTESTEDTSETAGALLSQLKRSEEEVQRLKGMMSPVQRLVGAGFSLAEEASSKRLLFPEAYNIEHAGPAMMAFYGAAQDHLENSASVYSHSSDSSSPLVELGYQQSDQLRNASVGTERYTSTLSSAQHYLLQQPDLYNGFGRLSVPAARPEPPTSEPIDFQKNKVEGDLFFLSDREVNRVLAGGHQSFANQPLDEDIIVRAVLYGWRDVQDQYLLDKGWQALRSIDQSSFHECGVVERMALLQMMRLKLLHQTNTNPQYLAALPPFFERSPSEDPEVLKQMPIIEHFIWPGLRHFLCMNPKKYTNNKFSDSFRQSFKFVWPFEVSHIYMKDPVTQLYSITPGFKQQQQDIRSWTMRKEFFENSSELIGAIPVYEGPLNLCTAPAGSRFAAKPLQSLQRTHQQVAVEGVGEQEMDGSQLESGLGQDHAPARRQTHVSQHVTMGTIPGPQVPYSAEVEAWLGDPDLIPQYWNMAAQMDAHYEATHQWQNVQTAYIGCVND